jgi:hypothetical protein
MSTAEKDAIWYEMQHCRWEVAAQALEAQGYERQADTWYPAVFVKAGEPSLVLVRNLGAIEWYTRQVN